MNENTFWLIVWSMLGLTIILVIGMSLIYNQGKNEKLLAATSCFQLVTIEGGYVEHRMALCLLEKKK